MSKLNEMLDGNFKEVPRLRPYSIEVESRIFSIQKTIGSMKSVSEEYYEERGDEGIEKSLRYDIVRQVFGEYISKLEELRYRIKSTPAPDRQADSNREICVDLLNEILESMRDHRTKEERKEQENG